jgi:phage/plasmid primase-like uncharacterized protein
MIMERLTQALNNFGLDVTAPVLDGAVQRCLCRGSRQMNGWYVGNVYNNHVYCTFGDWRTGDKQKFTDNGVSESTETISVWLLLAKAARQKREKLHQVAAQKTMRVLTGLPPMVTTGDTQGHPYLKKKGVRAYGEVRQEMGKLIIPLYKPNGSATGYQTIDKDGNKKFLFGTNKEGACFAIDGSGATICVCEGYATGASIHEATGFTVLVAFDAGNMVAVAKELFQRDNENVLICADNDHACELKNTGIEAAKKISTEYGYPYIYPTDIAGTDFNDMHQELGIEAVQRLVIKGRVIKVYKKKTDDDIKHLEEILNPPGILKDIADYFNETAVKPQPLFGIAAGIILGSVMMGRKFNTGAYGNYTSLYFVISAKSGTGKDHVKTVVRRILKAAGMEYLERAGGFTAANTVVKSLERQPCQLSFWEEFGLRLKEAGSNDRSLYGGVLRQLLDVWSSCHSETRGEEYSDGTIPQVKKPALTLVGLSTPDQLFEAMTQSLIEQGFVNRILPFVSNAKRSVTPLVGHVKDPPEKIVEWCKALINGNLGEVGAMPEGYNSPGDNDEVLVEFTQDALDRLHEVERGVVAKSDHLDKIGLSDLLSRNREITMRVALIVAVMDGSDQIKVRHVDWSWRLVDALFEQYTASIKRVSSGSGFEQAKKQALADLRARGDEGIKQSAMPKTSPWSKWEKKLRNEILVELQDSGLAELIDKKTGKRGPATTVWVATESDEQ